MKKITILLNLFAIAIGFSQPTTNAALPTRLQADVFSVYSDSYTPIAGVSLTPFWGQPAGYVAPNTSYNPTGATTNPNYAYHASTLTYQGIEFGDKNLTQTGMEKLHLDVYTTNCTSLEIYIIGRNAGERKVTVTPTLNGWNSFDIPLTDYSSQGLALTAIFQFKFVSVTPANSNVFFDNIYFWKEPTAAGTPVYGAFSIPAKNTGEADFAITAPTSTSPAPITYSSGNTAVATIVSGNMIHIVGPGTSVITASQVAQGAFIAGSTTANFVVSEVPTVAAPTPPYRAPENVISLFSDVYTNITVDNWNQAPIWYAQTGKPVLDVMIATNPTKKIEFAGDGFIGVVLNARNNATAMTHFHMDYWVPSNTNLVGKVLNPKWSNHPGTGGENNVLLLTNPVTTAGSWVTLDVPLSTFLAQGPVPSYNREALKEFLITSNLGDVYVDNIYLHNNNLSTQNFSALNVKMYPNPASSILNIEARAAIQNVSIYNMLGQEVISKTTDNASISIDVAGLQAGMYIIKTTIDGVTAASRFVKQ